MERKTAKSDAAHFVPGSKLAIVRGGAIGQSRVMRAWLVGASAFGIWIAMGSAYADGQFKDGTELAKYCAEGDKMGNWLYIGLCEGYIIGAVDSYSSTQTLLNERMFDLPANMTHGDIVKVVRKHMDEHPEMLKKAADSIVWTALHEAYPCE